MLAKRFARAISARAHYWDLEHAYVYLIWLRGSASYVITRIRGIEWFHSILKCSQKGRRVLACQCLQNACNCSHARILVKIICFVAEAHFASYKPKVTLEGMFSCFLFGKTMKCWGNMCALWVIPETFFLVLLKLTGVRILHERFPQRSKAIWSHDDFSNSFLIYQVKTKKRREVWIPGIN